MRRVLITIFALISLLLVAASSMAAARQPTKAERAAIVRSINAGLDVPAPSSCFLIRVSTPGSRIAGVTTRTTAACVAVHDTQFILYGTKSYWYQLAASNNGQTLLPQCNALRTLIGTSAWQDIAVAAAAAGCDNFDTIG